MKQTKTIILISAFLFFACGKSDEEKTKIVTQISHDGMKMTMPSVMQLLSNRANKVGFAKALEFCKTNINSINQQKSQVLEEVFKKRFQITSYQSGRTSLKNRNPQNAPDKTEKSILSSWQKQIASGQKPKLTVKEDEQGTWYGLIPIYISSPLCLNCHGDKTQIKPKTKKALQKNYPEDKATDFALHDLRGAFVTKIKF